MLCVMCSGAFVVMYITDRGTVNFETTQYISHDTIQIRVW